MRSHDELLHYGIKGMKWNVKKKSKKSVKVDLNKLVKDLDSILSSPSARAIVTVPIADAMVSARSSWDKAIKRSRYIDRTIKRPKLTGYRID